MPIPCPHFKLTITQRSLGQSAVAGAAYQSGESLFSEYDEIWRHAWEVVQNDYLERNGRSERVDLRSYVRQGVDKIPTVHMGPAVCQMEKRGIRTNIGDLNRDIKAANSLMASIRAPIRHLKAWLDTLANALEMRKEPTVPALLARYMEMREDERASWSAMGQLKGTAADFDKVMQAISYLKENRLISVDAFRVKLSATQSKADTIRKDMRVNEKRMKVIAAMLDAYRTYLDFKLVYDAYSKKGFKQAKEKYAVEYKDELAAMKKAYGYLMHHGGVDDVPVQALQAEYNALREQNRDKETRLAAIQGDLRKLKEIRAWVDKVIPGLLPDPAEQKQERSSVLAKLQEASPQPSVHPAKQKTQDMEH